MSPRSVLRKLVLTAVVLCVSGSLLVVNAGLRGKGKYSGVVIFDRWDTCLLLSGVYITYVSGAVKEELRPYRNRAIQVDASVVSQPMNPGDALIHKYTIIGFAPRDPRGQAIEGVSIKAHSDFDSNGTTAFLITIENSAGTPIEIDSGEIGPTLLGLKKLNIFAASDGNSTAWITRATLLHSTNLRVTIGNQTLSADYDIDPKIHVPARFTLRPGETKQARVLFRVPSGPYQFLVGFGGGVHEGKSIASNAISFHVDDDGKPFLEQEESEL